MRVQSRLLQRIHAGQKGTLGAHVSVLAVVVERLVVKEKACCKPAETVSSGLRSQVNPLQHWNRIEEIIYCMQLKHLKNRTSLHRIVCSSSGSPLEVGEPVLTSCGVLTFVQVPWHAAADPGFRFEVGTRLSSWPGSDPRSYF